MIIWTYFDADCAKPGDGELMRIWRLSWERRGWEPRILTPRSAKDHPRYKDAEPEARRWMGLHLNGGGWFSEYDVINYSYAPWTPDTTGVLGASFRVWPALGWADEAGAATLVDRELGGKLECSHGSYRMELEGCEEFGHDRWETSATVHFSAQSIFRHFGCEIPAWKVITSADRRF